MRYALIMLLLAGCAVGPYADKPRYALPSTRAVAARQLNEALAFGGRGVSEVAADELRLTWHERRQITDARWVLLDRELRFQEVLAVRHPERPGEWWELEVAATGGVVTFEFQDVESAGKAEAAMRRLMPKLTEDEKRRLFAKYVVVLEGGVDRYLTDKNGKRVPNPDYEPVYSAIEFLKALTGENFGDDGPAWRQYGSQAFPFEP